MKDSDIIKSMHSCANDTTCAKCLYQQHYQNGCCQSKLIGDALGLIKRQQAEIERLKTENAELEAEVETQYEQARADILGNMADGGVSCHWCIAENKKNAIKDFAERIKATFPPRDKCTLDDCYTLDKIDEIVAEMEGENEENPQAKDFAGGVQNLPR